MKLMKLGKKSDPAMSSRIIQFIGCALIFFLGANALARAQDISSIKSMLAAKQCPASEYSRITYDDRGCGYSMQKACDQGYRAPSQAWQDCYSKMGDCRKQIDADNQVIYEANRVFRLCNQHKSDVDQSSTGSQPRTGYSSSSSPSQNDSGSSDLASRLAAQRAKNATADDVRRQQDQKFSDTVRSTQQQYQQFKAQEEAEQEARQQAARQSRRYEQRAQSSECVPKDLGYGNYCYYKKCGVYADHACIEACLKLPPCE